MTVADDQPNPASEPEIQTEAPAQVEEPHAQYRLQTEDVLRITVWGEPNLTAEHMVDPQGNINMSLLGQVHVEGLTHNELIGRLKEGLSEYLVDPKVQVTLGRFRSPKVHVLGQVHRPGLHEIKLGDKVMEAIAQAGSFTEAAYLEKATLTRKGSEEPISLNLRKLFYDTTMICQRTWSWRMETLSIYRRIRRTSTTCWVKCCAPECTAWKRMSW